MRTGRPVARIELPDDAAGILEGYTQRRKTAQALALRARIVLGCASGLSNKAVAARERVTVQTVGKWRRRFVERGLIVPGNLRPWCIRGRQLRLSEKGHLARISHRRVADDGISGVAGPAMGVWRSSTGILRVLRRG